MLPVWYKMAVLTPILNWVFPSEKIKIDISAFDSKDRPIKGIFLKQRMFVKNRNLSISYSLPSSTPKVKIHISDKRGRTIGKKTVPGWYARERHIETVKLNWVD